MANQQLTGALASWQFQPSMFTLNFDVCFYKAAPPQQYGAVGSELSPIRFENAESGQMKVLAQKLGALFSRCVPPIPTIVSKYGERASEISRQAAVTRQMRRSSGAFHNNLGADATSLWAAITTGSRVIAVHLLACLLARLWNDDQATAIWMELIDRRRKQILSSQDLDEDVLSIYGARAEITKEHVAKWQASARAWLEIADQAMLARQQKIDMVMKKMGCSVNDDADTYTNVMTAWEHSLLQIEGLLQGISQRAQSGDVLLALSAWHLYPDLDILRPERQSIIQEDHLGPTGSILTIGPEVPCNPAKGVYWSLPLKHLRPYGPPVRCDDQLDLGRTLRPTCDDLMMATLGSYLKSWGRYGNNTQLAVRWMSWLGEVLNDVAQGGSVAAPKARALLGSRQEASWLRLLTEAANRYQESSGTPKDYAWHMLRQGQERSDPFIGAAAHPFFDLLEEKNILRLLKTEDERIEYLRRIAEQIQIKYTAHAKDFMIRYRRGRHFEYASGLPCLGPPERGEDGIEQHFRILFAGGKLHNETNSSYWEWCENVHRRKNHSNLYRSNIYHRGPLPLGGAEILEEAYHHRQRKHEEAGEMVLKLEDHYIDDLFPTLGIGAPRSDWLGSPSGENFATYGLVYGDPDYAALYYARPSSSAELLDYRLLNTKLLYLLSLEESIDRAWLVRYLYDHLAQSTRKEDHFASLRAASTAAHVYKLMPNATMDIRVLSMNLAAAKWVRESGNEDSRAPDLRPPTPVRSRSPSPSARTPMNLPFRPRSPSSRFSSRAPSRAQSPAQWQRIREDDDPAPETPANLRLYRLTTKQAFACILMFESGRFNIHPYEMRSVMALSSGNSLFVGAMLVCDPWDQPGVAEIRHYAGNIGRPGIAALVPPGEPMIQDPDGMKAVWRIGGPEERAATFAATDMFEHTTLHLEYTGVDQPFESVPHERSQVYRLETLVRVFDHGDWIADLDVYRHLEEAPFTKASQSAYLTPPPSRRESLTYTVTRVPKCPGHAESPAEEKGDDRRPRSLSSSSLDSVLPAAMFQRLDSWYDILRASPLHVNVVCAHGNWEARLAAAAVCRALGYKTYIVPERVCWACVKIAGAEACGKKVVLV